MALTNEQTANGEATTAVTVHTVPDVHAEKTKDNTMDPDSVVVDDSPEIKKQQKEILINMAVICFSFLLTTTAVSGLTNLQSSLNSKSGLGQTYLTILYLLPLVSSILLASTVVRMIGYKRSMVVGLLLMCAFPAANLYPKTELMYTGATVSGLFGGILWASHGAYVTALGKRYAALGNRSSDSVIARFFGCFFTTHRLSMVIGSLMSSIILQRPDEVSHLPPDVVRRICGSAYCYEDLSAGHWTDSSVNATSSYYRPSSLQLYCLYGLYSACVLLAPVLLAVFLRKPIRPFEDPDTGKVNVLSNVAVTLRNLVDLKMILLMPIMILHGASQGFIFTDYCVGYISCTIGIDSIGYVMATFGLTSVLTAFGSGLLIKYTGRPAMFSFSAVWTLATLTAMWRWTPDSSHPEVLYGFAALWGVCTTVWTTQLISYVGFIYRDKSPQSAMASYYAVLNVSIGGWFWTARNLCLHSQLHLMMLLLVVGMVGYMMVEILVRRAEKKSKEHVDQTTTTMANNVQITKI